MHDRRVNSATMWEVSVGVRQPIALRSWVARLLFVVVWSASSWPLSAQAARGGGQSLDLQLIFTLAIGLTVGWLIVRFIGPFFVWLFYLTAPFQFGYFCYQTFPVFSSLHDRTMTASLVIGFLGSAVLVATFVVVVLLPSLFLWKVAILNVAQYVLGRARRDRNKT